MEHFKDGKHELVEDSNSCPMHICNFYSKPIDHTKRGSRLPLKTMVFEVTCPIDKSKQHLFSMPSRYSFCDNKLHPV
jgi:hypothetical protein